MMRGGFAVAVFITTPAPLLIKRIPDILLSDYVPCNEYKKGVALCLCMSLSA